MFKRLYYVCGYCGKQGSKPKKKRPPKCNCKEGGGKTYMSPVSKESYISWKKNKKRIKNKKSQLVKPLEVLSPWR